MLLGDCRDVLTELPCQCVDHVIADPPYDRRTHENAKSTAVQSGTVDFGFSELTDMAHVPMLFRASRGWIVCFCSLEQLGDYRDSAGDGWVRAGIWNREAGAAFARADRPFQGAEGIAIMHWPRAKDFPAGAKRAVWTSTTARDDRVHPTQKPTELMLELVHDFTRADHLVLDSHAGSGTTGVACLRLGRRVILIERDPKYAALATERMRAEEQGLSLAAKRAGQVPLFG